MRPVRQTDIRGFQFGIAVEIFWGNCTLRNVLIRIFDGGPKIAAPTRSIRTVAMSREATVKELAVLPFDADKAIICNDRIDYRCLNGQLKELEGDGVRLQRDLAALLEVKVGDRVRYITFT